MPREIKPFHSTITSLWLRLISVGIIAFVFAEALVLASGKAQGWTFYLTAAEVSFETVVRLVAAALVGVVAGTLFTVATAPLLWFLAESRVSVVDKATEAAAVAAIFLDSRFTIKTIITTYNLLAGWPVKALFTAHFLAFVAAFCFPRTRKGVTTSLDAFLGEKMTRRTAIATAVGTVALVATESFLGKAETVVRAAPVAQRPKPNLLLITFDALTAEDMSLYGYSLPTTPHIDAFAGKATVFTNFYSASTFTTPSVATILTGLRPSETHVYQLQGKLKGVNTTRNLAHLLRRAGYATGASVSNPFAYYLADGLPNDFDFLPGPDYRVGGVKNIWDATSLLHQRTGYGSRAEELADLEATWNVVLEQMDRWDPQASYRSWCPPATSFKQGSEVLAKLPDGFFMWVHVLAPHFPYIPDPADQGRFLASNEMLTSEEYRFAWFPNYDPKLQSRIDKAHLRYDELVVSADRAFGAFMSQLESSGRLRNTTVIVSSDHGESFTGGVYSHGSPYQTRPVIHVPLIVKTPGQQESRKVAFTADQTALAPTILDLAGQPKPEWMPGRSLAPWLQGSADGAGEGLAFTEYLETNSVFKPLHHGTVGVIDGKNQYVLNLASGKGTLRPLPEAHIWSVDRQADNPAAAKALRETIYSRFSDLPRNTA